MNRRKPLPVMIVIGIAILICGTGVAGATTILDEGFEDGVIPATWTVHNVDGGDEWEAYSGSSYAHTGSYSARIKYDAPNDDWLITPKLTPEAGSNTLSFWYRVYGSSYPESFNVKLSTTGTDVADFTVTLDTITTDSETYLHYTKDLSAYEGDDIYIAVQYISDNQYYLYVDDFSGIPLTPPCFEVEKKVYNGTDWVDEISNAQLGDIYRFRINVTANCCNFTEVVVKDTLSSSLTYEDDAIPFPPNSTVGNVRYWNFSALDKGETVTIEFDVNASTYGYDCNIANVTANCTDQGGVIYALNDTACLNIAPLPNTFDAVWDNTDDVASTLGEDIFDICTANDLDEDGSQEIITGDQNGNVTVFENTGNDQYTDVWHVTPDGNEILAVCVCDLDGNGRKEIIAGGKGGTVYVYEWDGANDDTYILVSNTLDFGYDDIWDLCCSDIDGDGDQELGIAAGDTAYIYSVSGGWTWNQEMSHTASYDVQSVLCGCDLDNNNDKEFLFGHWNYDEIFIYESTAPDTYVHRCDPEGTWSDGRPLTMVCSDFDGDGYQEVYAGDNNGQLLVLTCTDLTDCNTCTYSLIHDFGTAINKIACGDEDADGMNDLYLAMDDNDITDLEFFGTDVTDYSHYFKSVIGVDLNAGNDASAVHCTDLDGDGNREVIAGYEKVYSYPGMKLLHVLEHSASCTLPGIDADKTVYDPKTDTWVDSISGAIPGETYRFRINVTATCCNFTDVVINDTLSPSLGYAGNPSPSAPTVIGNVYQWTFPTLNKSETKTIEFDATVSYRGYDCNLANATGWCNESLPHEQHSDEDTACIDSRVDLAVKQVWNEHIKLNPACANLEFYRAIVNESNTIRVWVENNGPSNITAGESFDVRFDLNGVQVVYTTLQGPLNAGEDEYYDIVWTPDCTGGPEWPDYPPMPDHPSTCISPGYRLNVTVDPSNTVNETDDSNNLGWRTVSICNSGYKSKNFDCDPEDPLTSFEYYDDLYGGVVYNVSGVRIAPDDPEYCFCPAETSTRVHHIDIPSGMNVVKARLYVYWYDWGNLCPSGGSPPGSLADLSVSIGSSTFTTPDAAYNDQKGLGAYNYPKGTYAYDVTSEITGSNDYTVVIENTDPANCTIPLGELLLVVYEDPTQDPDNHIQLWMMEGCDLLRMDSGYCVTTDESTATVAFPGTVAAGFTSAELITVVAQGKELTDNMLFNGNVIKTDAWSLGSEAGTPSTNSPEYDNGSNVFVEVVDVTGDMTLSDNTVGFQDTGTQGMQASNAILIVHKPTGAPPGEPVDTATGTGTAYFETDNGAIIDLIAVSEGDLPPEGKPDLQFPHGLFSFNITGLTGNTATVTITMPSNVPVGTEYWKYGPTPSDPTDHWYQIPMGSDDGDNVITITLMDGGLGDDDLTINGVIVDDGGPGTPPPAEVPAMTPLGFVLVMFSLFGLVVFATREVNKR